MISTVGVAVDPFDTELHWPTIEHQRLKSTGGNNSISI